MLKKSFLFAFLLAVSALAMVELASAQQERLLTTNKELVARASSVYVETDTFWMKREALESSLLGKPEFKPWEMQITGRRELASRVAQLKRIPLSNSAHDTATN